MIFKLNYVPKLGANKLLLFTLFKESKKDFWENLVRICLTSMHNLTCSRTTAWLRLHQFCYIFCLFSNQVDDREALICIIIIICKLENLRLGNQMKQSYVKTEVLKVDLSP